MRSMFDMGFNQSPWDRGLGQATTTTTTTPPAPKCAEGDVVCQIAQAVESGSEAYEAYQKTEAEQAAAEAKTAAARAQAEAAQAQARATEAQARAAAGGGISTGTLVAGGVGLAAVAALIAALA